MKAGVIGDPIAQSLSPFIHGYWIKENALDATYDAIPVQPEDLEDKLKQLADQGFSGVNVTLPHKQAVYELCDELSETAQSIGAVNVLTFQDGKYIGQNSDAFGFWQHFDDSLKRSGRGPLPRNARVLVYGAGGAARAVMHALKSYGVTDVTVMNRTEKTAEALCQNFGLGSLAPWEHRLRMIRDFDLIINTTSLGMEGQPFLFVANAIPKLKESQIAYDLVYKPLQTRLLQGCMAKGAVAINGLGMLIQQAVPSFGAFFGVTPDVTDALRVAVEKKLA